MWKVSFLSFLSYTIIYNLKKKVDKMAGMEVDKMVDMVVNMDVDKVAECDIPVLGIFCFFRWYRNR